jgi:hypothetical protein
LGGGPRASPSGWFAGGLREAWHERRCGNRLGGQASLDDAKEHVATQAERKEVSCFLSYSVSVDKEAYVLALEELKKTVFEFATGIESQEGDTLVRPNLQVYPTREL